MPIEGVVEPNEEYEWEVELVAPEKEGKYSAYFRMVTGNNHRFGHKVWCTIIVQPQKQASEVQDKVQSQANEEEVKDSSKYPNIDQFLELSNEPE